MGSEGQQPECRAAGKRSKLGRTRQGSAFVWDCSRRVKLAGMDFRAAKPVVRLS